MTTETKPEADILERYDIATWHDYRDDCDVTQMCEASQGRYVLHAEAATIITAQRKEIAALKAWQVKLEIFIERLQEDACRSEFDLDTPQREEIAALKKALHQSDREVNALLSDAARHGEEPDLLLREWHTAIERAERAEEAFSISKQMINATEAELTTAQCEE